MICFGYDELRRLEGCGRHRRDVPGRVGGVGGLGSGSGSGAKRTLGWDASGSLSSVEVGASEPAYGAGEAGFVYDASGERLTRTDAAGYRRQRSAVLRRRVR
ncbi:hypothetical protein CCO02nite_31100 [Cellulomonas composti]|uniref:Uncharacterized protein n=1 Tax=Cellulomonas composti TaxID=266130 RepID=A0A511JEP9_9CELL|nr:hypothetical protein CCO02nite_31100 [Cellulomonas composti]